jgi:hypothetical protein
MAVMSPPRSPKSPSREAIARLIAELRPRIESPTKDYLYVRCPPRLCEKAMFKSLCVSGPEARLGLLAV